jgi:hypothetical protein
VTIRSGRLIQTLRQAGSRLRRSCGLVSSLSCRLAACSVRSVPSQRAGITNCWSDSATTFGPQPRGKGLRRSRTWPNPKFPPWEVIDRLHFRLQDPARVARGVFRPQQWPAIRNRGALSCICPVVTRRDRLQSVARVGDFDGSAKYIVRRHLISPV